MMTKKILFISLMCFTAISAVARDVGHRTDTIFTQEVISEEQMLSPLKPTYLKNVSEAANWGKNWFIEVKGGASAFLGSPIGCGDVFDRLTPALQVGLGKWFTPAVGGRVEFQGLNFKNAEFNSMKYQFVHADFMYNLTAFIRQNDLGLSRWDVIPFVGVGMIHNSDWTADCMCPGHVSGSHPFAFAYGIEARYRVCNRMHVIAEISGMTTAKSFDAVGTSTKFGDNMLSLSAGLSFTLGKVGFARVTDAKPYIAQNEWLIDYANSMKNRNSRLSKQHQDDERIKAEYRKILAIEGLLNKYHVNDDSEEAKRLYPKNDYSGLNSLRARLNNRNWDGSTDSPYENVGDSLDGMNMDADMQAYISAMLDKKVAIGAPVYFFFRIGTTNLSESAQMVNIDKLAQIAKAHNLKVHIIGAADSATGSKRTNDKLSRKRAEYVKDLLIDRGVDEDNIITKHKGGVNVYSPAKVNRTACVKLSF